MSVELLCVEAGKQSIAVLAYSARRPRSVAIVAGHGYSSSKHNLDPLCGFLASHGYAMYSLDFPGHKLGASGGRLDGFGDCVDAMLAVVTHARGEGYTTVYTLGLSMGALTALAAAGADSAVSGAISIATGLGPPPSLGALEARGRVDLRASYVEGSSLPEIVAQAQSVIREAVPRLSGRPQLYVAASRDMLVPPSSVAALADNAPQPNSIVTIERDHTLAGENARSAVLGWFGDRHPRPAAQPADSAVPVS